MLVLAIAYELSIGVLCARSGDAQSMAVEDLAIYQQNGSNEQYRRDCRGEARSYRVKGQIMEVTLGVWGFVVLER